MADTNLLSGDLSVAALNRELVAYRVVRQIGHGAMGVVYEAEQRSIGRRVALKLLPANLALRERTVKRFLREAEAMGRLAHANIVDVHEVGSIGNLHYFSMKFVEGPPLDRVLRAGPLAIGDVVSIGIDVAGALAHAHSRGVLHRDVKPANLLRDGERVVLTDFGLARPLDSEDGGSMTESGDLVGTPLYMSPEQISGDADKIDGRSDVWGLGVTLYELLVQRPPFSGPNAQGILHAILHRDPPLLHKLRDDVPRELEAVLLKCLEKDTSRRYSGAAALLEDLTAVHQGRPVSASPPRFFDPALRWIRRHPAEAIVVAVSLLVALVLGLSWRQSSKLLSSREEDLRKTVTARDEAKTQQALAIREKTVASTRYELSEARMLWASDSEGDKEEAEARVFDLLESIETYKFPDIAAESIALLAGWMHERGRDADVLKFLGESVGRLDQRTALVWRAAGYTGLQQFTNALQIHGERARLDPRDVSPRLDAARLHRRIALSARSRSGRFGGEEDLRLALEVLAGGSRDGASPEIAALIEFKEHMGQALALLGSGLDLAVQAKSEELATTLLLERARCQLDLGDHESARSDLERIRQRCAAAQEDVPVEVKSLSLRVERRARPRDALPTAAEESVAETLSAPPVALPGILPNAAALDARDLENAGRGLQSIYKGFRKLLRSAATPSDATRNAANESGNEAPGSTPANDGATPPAADASNSPTSPPR